MSLIQASEVDNSNQMEKKGFIEILQMFKDENITPTQITTDRLTQIRKYMREKKHKPSVWRVSFRQKHNEKANTFKSESIL